VKNQAMTEQLGPASYFLGGKFSPTLFRHENNEALRQRPSCIQKNADQLPEK